MTKYMGIWDYAGGSNWLSGAGSAIGSLGTALNLPEFGISEALGAEPAQPYQSPAPAPTQTTSTPWLGGGSPSALNVQPTSGTTGGTQPVGDVLGDVAPEQQVQQDAGPSAYDMLQGNWDAYVADLDAQLGTLGGMKTAQEGTVTGQAAKSQNVLDLQKTQGLQQLGQQETKTQENQVKNIRDLAANVTQAMRAGNVYLGARGAGDSSAARQYSYALGKRANREQSNVMQNTAQIMNEIAGRETNLNNIFNTETKNLEEEKNINLNKVAQWYDSAVMTIQGQKTQDRQALSQQILDQAMSALQNIQQQAADRRTALDQWAINNSDSMNQLKANMQQVAQFSPQLPQAGPVAGGITPSTGQSFSGYGGGFGDEDEDRLF